MRLGNRGMEVMDIVYFSIILLVGLGIVQAMSTSGFTMIGPATTHNTTPQYAAMSNISGSTFGSFLTLSNAPQIMGAVVILGIVGFLVMRK